MAITKHLVLRGKNRTQRWPTRISIFGQFEVYHFSRLQNLLQLAGSTAKTKNRLNTPKNPLFTFYILLLLPQTVGKKFLKVFKRGAKKGKIFV